MALSVLVAQGGTPAIIEFSIPRAGNFPHDPAVGADGIVWYTDQANSYIGRLDPATGAVREWASPGGASAGPYGIAVGSDGRIWYDEARTGRLVGFDPGTGQVSVVTIPTPGAIVRNMAADTARGRIWLALSGTGRIGELELGGPR